MTQDQLYFREKLRRHNRLLHGWGIVCGVLVAKLEGTTVKVTPGYALGPYGDEILVADDVRFDVARHRTAGGLDCGGDPWCADTHVLADDRPAYLAIRHVERDTRPVRAPACGCGCDDTACEYSRVRDGFELAVLEELPESYRTAQRVPLEAATSCDAGRRDRCLACPTDPWVILADVTLSGGAVAIQLDPHRRYVASYGAYWFDCPGA